MADVPTYNRVLTMGEGAIHKVAEEDHDKVLALETGAKLAVILHTADMVQSSLLALIKGALATHGYSKYDAVVADAATLKAIAFAEKSKAGQTYANRNEYLDAAREWIRYALDNRASDIHIRSKGNSGQVFFRIDGEVEPMRSPNHGVYTAAFLKEVMTALYNSEQVSKSGSATLFNGDAMMYCMIPHEDAGQRLRLRFQSLRGDQGPAAIMRLMTTDPNRPTRTFAELGYANSHIKSQWAAAQSTPSGMILIAGVTGSGKTTTMQVVIEEHSSVGGAWYTIEDPVELPIRGAHQIPMQRDLSDEIESTKRFREVLSSIVRADPDGALIGEIRDRHTALAAQQLAETGHMALGTVHAHLMSGIVPRLTNPEIGMTRETLASPNMLSLLVYQALVPILCPECALDTLTAKDDPQVAHIVESMAQLSLDTTELRWKRPMGCGHCKRRGTIGQTVVAEMMMPDEVWCRHIRAGEDAEALTYWRMTSDGDLLSENMDGKTVFEHTLWKAMQAKNKVDVRQCLRFDNFPRFVASYKRLQQRKAAQIGRSL